MAICNLCNEEKETLQRKSHIIPSFFFRYLRNKEGELKKFRAKDVREGEPENGVSSKEEFEHGILCEECEKEVLNGKYEDYVAKVLSGDGLSRSKLPRGTEFDTFVEFENVDLARVKLFFLSILWRASISDRQVYSEIQLDSSQQEKLRRMILDGDPGEDTDFPFAIYSFAGDNELPDSAILQPKDLGDGGYMFVLTGFVILFDTRNNFLSDHETIEGENGLRIWKMSPEDRGKLVWAYFGRRAAS